MRIITTRKSASGYNNAHRKDLKKLNEFDINSPAVLDAVRKDIEDGMGILFVPTIEERAQLLGLFKLIQDLGIDGVTTAITHGLDKLLYSSMKEHIKTLNADAKD